MDWGLTRWLLRHFPDAPVLQKKRRVEPESITETRSHREGMGHDADQPSVHGLR